MKYQSQVTAKTDEVSSNYTVPIKKTTTEASESKDRIKSLLKDH